MHVGTGGHPVGVVVIRPPHVRTGGCPFGVATRLLHVRTGGCFFLTGAHDSGGTPHYPWAPWGCAMHVLGLIGQATLSWLTGTFFSCAGANIAPLTEITLGLLTGHPAPQGPLPLLWKGV